MGAIQKLPNQDAAPAQAAEGATLKRLRRWGIGQLFDVIREAVVVADAETGRIVLRNPSAETLLGYTVAEASRRDRPRLGFLSSRNPGATPSARRQVAISSTSTTRTPAAPDRWRLIGTPPMAPRQSDLGAIPVSLPSGPPPASQRRTCS